MSSEFAASVLFNCKSLKNFAESIVEILPFRGISMSQFYLCKYKRVLFLTKLSFYRKTPAETFGVSKALPHIDAEIQILEVLRREITEKNLSPCILEMVYYKICDNFLAMAPPAAECVEMLTEPVTPAGNSLDFISCRYASLIRSGMAHNKCAFLVLDRCDITLETYLRKMFLAPVSIKIFKSLLFMTIFTMYVINRKYPGFRHNDLHTANVMLKFNPDYNFDATNMKFYKFTAEGRDFYVPYFGIIPKIIDFGLSTLPEKGIVSNATEDPNTMFSRSDNDIILLFHWIYVATEELGDAQLQVVDSILRALEPTGVYVQNHASSIREIQSRLASYSDMMLNDTWEDYIKPVPNSQILHEFSPVDNNE